MLNLSHHKTAWFHNKIPPVTEFFFGQVTNEVALQSYDALRSSGANISYVEYEGLTHMTNDAEFQDVLEFWTYVLPPLAP